MQRVVCGENEFNFPTDVFENSYGVSKVFTSCSQYLPGFRSKVQPDTRKYCCFRAIHHHTRFRATFSFRNFDTDNFLEAVWCIYRTRLKLLCRNGRATVRRDPSVLIPLPIIQPFSPGPNRPRPCSLPRNVYHPTRPNATFWICNQLLLLLLLTRFWFFFKNVDNCSTVRHCFESKYWFNYKYHLRTSPLIL